MKIVDINRYKRKRENIIMFEGVILELKKNGQAGKEYTNIEASEIAQRILSETAYYNKTSTPINRIAEDFGITPYRTDSLSKDISGVIYIGGTTKKIYHTDKVILVDQNEPSKHQRFVIAHEIAHYLFDCLSNPKYNNPKFLFAESYPKKDHCSSKEFRADRFAAELLMPTDLFIEQYNIAMNEKNNYLFTIMYLSEFFQTKTTSIEKRINEVLG